MTIYYLLWYETKPSRLIVAKERELLAALFDLAGDPRSMQLPQGCHDLGITIIGYEEAPS